MIRSKQHKKSPSVEGLELWEGRKLLLGLGLRRWGWEPSLRVDIGAAFTKVLVDDLMNPVMFTYKGSGYRAVQLRKNDVVRVRVNDGAALKVEMVKSVRD